MPSSFFDTTDLLRAPRPADDFVERSRLSCEIVELPSPSMRKTNNEHIDPQERPRDTPSGEYDTQESVN
jgi:hypothetical protein